jgi:hypothetical protein
MLLIRVLISLFIMLLLASVAAGWAWTAVHQPSAQAAASHLVLAASAVAGLVGLTLIWRRVPDTSRG